MTEPTFPTGEEKQAALQSLRAELNQEENYVELLWGGTSIKWPDPDKFRSALSAHSDATYKALLLDMEEGEDSQQERSLCGFFLRIVEEENTAEEMERMEGKAIIASDLAPEDIYLEGLRQEIDQLLAGVEVKKRVKEIELRLIAASNLRLLNEAEFWKERRWTVSRQGISYIQELKTRLAISGLENLPQGASGEISVMISALQAARDRLQLPGREERARPRGGSEVTITSEAGRARIEVLRATVANCEAFLLTEESQGKEYSLLKKLELLKGNVSTTVEKMEKSQSRGLQLAPGEVEEVGSWLSRGHKCAEEIMKREMNCSTIPPPAQGNFSWSNSTKLKFKDIIPARFGKDPREYLS